MTITGAYGADKPADETSAEVVGTAAVRDTARGATQCSV
jgi:hypothetical protein